MTQDIRFDELVVSTLHPIIKWAGGKEKELKNIIPNIPQCFQDYFEPFVGGGAVFAAMNARRCFINDKSSELISLYTCIAEQDDMFFMYLECIISSWDKITSFVQTNRDIIYLCYVKYRTGICDEDAIKMFLSSFVDDNWNELKEVLAPLFVWHIDALKNELKKNLSRKIMRMKKLEHERGLMPENDVYDNIETAFKSSLYMYYRTVYNDTCLMESNIELATAMFVFIRNYSYSGMFRYNVDGQFNVPYGGIGYNSKTLRGKRDYYHSEELVDRLRHTVICNLDFEDFLRAYEPMEDDFMFLDPPYDSEFSTYAKNEFTRDDQRRLAYYLLNDCRCKWMLVIKNTPYIYSLYQGRGLNIRTFDKKYLVSFMNRNDKDVTHLLITNY